METVGTLMLIFGALLMFVGIANFVVFDRFMYTLPIYPKLKKISRQLIIIFTSAFFTCGIILLLGAL